MGIAIALLGTGCQEATDVADDAEVVVDAAPDMTADVAPPEPDAAAPDPDMAPPDMAPPEPDAAPPEPDMAPPEPDMEVGPPECFPALIATANPPAARPFDLVTVLAEGGTGAWRYDFLENNSGALLNEFTGAYLAGDIVGAIDRVRLTDDGCIGEAIVEIRVVPPMDVQPLGVEIEPEQGFTFEIGGGSGEFAFEMVIDLSGGDVSPDGAYLAGPDLGQDIVRVTDLGTDETVDVVVQVVEGPVTLSPSPPRLYLPVGSSMPLRVNGGSGSFDVAIDGDSAGYADGVIEGLAPGRAQLAITDRFLGLETSMRVDTVESLTAEILPFNASDAVERIHSPGDLNGDGVADFVVSNPQANDGAGRAGGLHVFHSGPDGFVDPPVQIIAATTRTDFFGYQVESADINDDSLVDLIVGARLMDVGVNDNGAVLVHLGQPDGTFEEAPAYVLAAPFGGDHLGYSVGVCDFNGDGRLDIAGGAILYEDRQVDQRANNQGGVLVWLGYEDGYLERPDSIVVGQRLEDDGRWVYDPNLQLGWDMATGDIDGDGLCDVAVSSQIYRDRNGGRNRANAGAVFVYRGVPPDDLGPGGLEAIPAMIMVDDSDSNQPRFGRKFKVGDLDADGLADIVVGAYLHDSRTINNNDHNGGGAFIFRGRELPEGGALEVTGLEQADWTMPSNSGGDQFGFSIAIGEVTGDDLPDVLIGAWTEDFPGRGDAGAIFVYAGQPDALPAAEPAVVLAGPEGNALLGQEVEVVGDIDGDGINDVVGHAERSDTVNRDVGDYYVFSGGPARLVEPPEGEEGEPALEPFRDPIGRLDMPMPNGHGWFGMAVALVGDVNGDGNADAVVGGPFMMTEGNGMRTGAGWFYAGDADGIPADGATPIANHYGLSGFDFGFQWAGPAGDIDGDGLADWFVLHRDDERANLADARLWVPDECKDGNNNRYRYRGQDDVAFNNRNNAGGVYIYRGQPDGVAAQPSYVFWPYLVNNQPEIVAGDFDVNGDGLDDVIIGGFRFDAANPAGGNFNDAGAVEIAYGRPPDPEGRIRVLCDRAFKAYGNAGSDQLGRSVTGIDDLDGDGCDEFAYGAINYDNGANNQGAAWVVSGFGLDCATDEPRFLRLTAGLANEQTGWWMASGDLDGDALAELAVGAPNHRVENQARGGVWVLRGSWLGSQLAAVEPTPNPRVVGEPPEGGGVAPVTWLEYRTDVGEPLPINPDGADWLIEGQVNGERMGSAVAIAGGKVAAGGPFAAEAGVPRVGVVRIYEASADGSRLRNAPWGVFVGETWRSEGRGGERIGAGVAGGRPAFNIGAFFGQGTGRDNGSAYVIDVD